MLERIADIASEGIPVRVIVRPGQEHQFSDLLKGLPVWAGTVAPEEGNGFVAQVSAGHLHDVGLA